MHGSEYPAGTMFVYRDSESRDEPRHRINLPLVGACLAHEHFSWSGSLSLSPNNTAKSIWKPHGFVHWQLDAKWLRTGILSQRTKIGRRLLHP